MMSGMNGSAAPTCTGELQVCGWCPQQQFMDVTSGGRHLVPHPSSPSSSSSSAEASCVHPLVPLLLYNDRHFPPSPPFSQPISSQDAREAGPHLCHHGNANLSRPPVKKPLNAFMLYMKEMRQTVLQEGRERESAAINRILGRRWHALSPSEQSKYYDLAQKERRLHMQLYPGWTARDNYGKRRRRQNQQRSGSVLDRFTLQNHLQ